VTYSYDRTAGKVDFGPADVEKLRKDVLLLMKNVDRAETFEDAQKFREAVHTWTDWYQNHIYEELIPNLQYAVRRWLTGSEEWSRSDYFQRQEDEWTKHWDKELRGPTWDLYLALREMPLESTRLLEKYQHLPPDDAKEVLLEKWRTAKKKWSEKVKRNARGAWNALTEFLDWLKSRNDAVLQRNVKEVVQQRLEGFAVRIIGYEPDDWSQQSLSKFEEGLKVYRQRASQVMPLLLKGQLPIEFHLHCKMDEGGVYLRDHIKVCATLSDPKRYAHTIAHEMGHHIWRTYVSKEMADFWDAAVKGDYKSLDLNDVLRVWHSGETLYDLESRLQHSDPVLWLQLQTLTDGYDSNQYKWYHREDVERYITERGPHITVPAHPITSYANKNREEAFCEVIGLLVGYGPRAVDPLVRSWLDIILPGQYKGGSVEERVSAAWKVYRGA
jgi:hypothetical protein